MVDPRYFAPFDLGEVLRNVEALKTSRFNRQQAQDEASQRKAERQALGDVFASPGAISESGALGHPSGESLGNLARVSPQMYMELQKHLGSLDANQREAELTKWKTAAPLLEHAKQLPYEQRRQLIQGAAPALMASGWTPEELQSFDPTDQAVDAMSALFSAAPKPQGLLNVAPGGTIFDPQTRQPVFSAPFAPRYMKVTGPGGTDDIVSVGGEGHPRAPGQFSFNAVPGAIVTSGYRTPEHNKAVGGVSNSYHTRLDANGNPMARDFVPPKGMTMGDLFSQMKARNPNLDVINEGDHVHIEPKGNVGGSRTVYRGGQKSSGASGGLTANQRVKLKSEAAAAIAAGADPAKVKARLRELGAE